MNINGMQFTIGADPELFITKNQSVVSAHGLIQGTKDQPFKVDKGAVQVDGMALEFNIDPASSAEEFQGNLDAVQKQLKDMIGDHEFCNAVSNYFDEKYLKTQPLEAIMLGCDPDFNAYTGQANPPPNADGMLRTVGGHVHVGGIETDDIQNPEHVQGMSILTRLLDRELGVYSILWDKDDDRRSLYGKAGAFRSKTYGMEYRTLSNQWIFNPKLVEFVYQSVERAITALFNGEDGSEEYAHIINNSDRGSDFFKNNPTAEKIKLIVGA